MHTPLNQPTAYNKAFAKLSNLQARWYKLLLKFKIPSQTSRGTMIERPVWFISIYQHTHPEQCGIGEAAPLSGLSIETYSEMPYQLNQFCHSLQHDGISVALNAITSSSLRFAVEMALLDLMGGGQRQLFDSPFIDGQQSIRINGLIWINDIETMLQAVEEKLFAGFSCLKLKIGSLAWQDEIQMLQAIRSRFTAQDIELRLDANGAFLPDLAMDRLTQLAPFDIHSIEQPIAPKQPQEMAKLCADSPIAIALDEELIGVNPSEKNILLQMIKPHFIILKPSLIGGFFNAMDWIECAKQHDIGWWITSALESNIGLNALAQWTASMQTERPQGLGTGCLFHNNIPSPLMQEGEWLKYDPEQSWRFPFVLKE